ncbi:aerial mycelium formation protein [Actinophytocola glycyrrhizae]|uniref:Aerial mycelium formation protein n=1 Tax=Actinophytocola glycyrrhizae TaxID=2044873 RepID=A0ABV9SED2_9PSEU
MIEVRPGGRRRIDRVLAPDYVQDLGRLDLAEVRGRRDDAAQEETDLSYLRRLLHGRIDIVKAEQKRRREGGSSSVVERLVEILADNVVGPAPSGSGRHQTLEPSRAEAHRRHVEALVSDSDLSDVASLPDERLDLALRTYVAEEESVSRRRREVQKVVDALNDEIGARYRAGSASVDTLLAAERGDEETPGPPRGRMP